MNPTCSCAAKPVPRICQCTGVKPNHALTLMQIRNGGVKPQSLRLSETTDLTVVKNLKLASYDRVIRKRKQICCKP